MITLMRASVQRARRLQGLQRVDDDDVAALHVDDPGPARLGWREPLEPLERVVGVEDGVQVTDQQDVRAASRRVPPPGAPPG